MSSFQQMKKIFLGNDTYNDEERKRAFFSLCIFISTPFIFIFAFDDLLHHRIIEGSLIIFFLSVLIVNLIALEYHRKLDYAYRISAGSVLVLLCYELAIGGGEEQAFVWFYFFPLVIFHLFGLKEGLLWSGTSLLIATVLFLSPLAYEYDTTTSMRFLFAYSVVLVLSFSLEASQRKYHKRLIEEKEHIEDALANVKTLRGMLPICSVCKRIRDSSGTWQEIEFYINQHSDAEFSHSICHGCMKKHYPDLNNGQD